jgi:hypothetical protein
MMRSSTFWEHEALANFWGQNKFQHSDCVTDCILKTESEQGEDISTITVYAHGHRAEPRTEYVSVLVLMDVFIVFLLIGKNIFLLLDKEQFRSRKIMMQRMLP